MKPLGQAPIGNRLAVLFDYAEENWPSMDLFGNMLVDCAALAEKLHVERFCPPFRRRFTRVPWFGRRPLAWNADRLLNRFRSYPRYLRQRRCEFDLFHLCDHSYSQLLHVLPPERTGVFCHDLDTFRCLLEPARDPRPSWFKAMARRILTGMQKAAVVFHTTNQVRQEIERHGLIDSSRLIQAFPGVAPEFTVEGPEIELTEEMTSLGARPFLLHVGSCIPRKRLDVLLDVFAALVHRHPDLSLVKVGGPWTREQSEQIERLEIGSRIIQLTGLTRPQIAALYRRAALVVLPSEAEGFGLPVIEALACGATVVVSDLPVLREVAEQAAIYCPVGDISVWVETITDLLQDPSRAPDPATRLARAAVFSWSNHARTIFGTYRRLSQTDRQPLTQATR